jgi:RNA polymerase sigma factor (sigma-70 family)
MDALDLEDLRATAARLLGPASADALGTPGVLVLVRRRVAQGRALEDALLAEALHVAGDDRRVADEFLATFLEDLMPVARRELSPLLRRFLDTGDLVQSVMGDLWPSVRELEFETRPQFRALLAQRMGWKASDAARGLTSGKRREDLRATAAGAEQHEPAGAARPEDALVDEEERALLHLRLLRLSERDRDLLQRHLAGQSPAEIAAALGSSRDAVYKGLQRAVARALQLK